MKEFADDNFKLDENDRKLSKRVENTVGKGEIARYEQFLLFPQCFLKACFPGASKGVIVWEWVKGLKNFTNPSHLEIFVLSRFYFTLYPFPKQQILDCSKLREFAACNFDGTSNFFFSHSVFKTFGWIFCHFHQI